MFHWRRSFPLGAIALQGIRQASPTIGENICVIGLGLLGQLSVQILKANGCNVIGIDVDKEKIDFVNENFTKALNRYEDNLIEKLSNFAKGKGFDKVIITAKATTNDPIIVSTKILQERRDYSGGRCLNRNFKRTRFLQK